MRDDTTVHLDREVMAKAKVVAALTGKSIRDYLRPIVQAPVEEDFRMISEELKSRHPLEAS